MLKTSAFKLVLLHVIAMLFLSGSAFGATRTASVSGNWNSTTTWGGSSVPTSADAVIINSGITVTVNVNAACNTLAFTTGSSGAALLTISGTNTLTVTSTVTVQRPNSSSLTNTIAINAGSMSCASVALQATTGSRVSSITIATGTLTVTGNITSAGVSSKIVFTDAGLVNVGGSFLSGTTGTLTPATGTVKYDRSGNQTIGSYTYYNLTLAGSGTKSESSATINGTLSMEETAVISGTPAYGANATLQYNTSTSRTCGTEWITPFAATGGVIISNTGAITLNAAKVLNAPLEIQASATLSSGNFSLTLNNHFTNDGTFTPGSGTVTLSGSSNQNLAGTSAITFNNLTVNNSAGITLSGSTDEIVNGSLTLSNGKITTGSNVLQLGNSATISGAGSTRYINGNLKKGIAANTTSINFEIGDNDAYAPVVLTFTGSTNSVGSITASTNPSDHPDINNSVIDPILSLNRYWTLSNDNVSGFTSFDAEFNYNAADLDAGADYAEFIAGNHDGASWTYPLISNSTSTLIDVIQLTEFGDFQFGQSAISPAACGYSDNGSSPYVADVVPCINIASNPITVSSSFGSHQYFTLNVIQGITYEVYTCNASSPVNQITFSVYREGSPASPAIAFSYSNTGNPCTSVANNAYVTFTPDFSGQVRVLLNRKYFCSSSQLTGITVMLNVKGGSNTLDNQTAAGSDSWIGHLYEGTNSGIAYNADFSNYLGYYTQTETFNETFGGGTNDVDCFTPVLTAGSSRASLKTITYSVRYRMNSTRSGLYTVDLGSDDGSRLAIDGSLVYNNWSDQSFSTRPRVLMSLNGSSSLVYDFNENAGASRVTFTNLSLVLANTLSSNTTQNICMGNSGSSISGDTYGSLPAGISLSNTGYQWTYSTTPEGARSNISGATSATFTPNTSSAPFNVAGTYYVYRNAVLSSSNNVSPNPYVATHESNAAIITINAASPASVSISATASTICAGTSVTFTATPTNGGSAPSYQWKVNGSNVGSNSPSYSSSSLTNGNTVTCVMTSSATCASGSPATSNTITMTVNPNLPVSVSIAASSNPVCASTIVTFTATPVNGGGSPTYAWKVNGNSVGSNSATYSTAGLSNNDVVTCILTSNASCISGNPATSNAVTMSVTPTVTASVTISASSTSICSGSSVTFTATPTNGGSAPSYQWKLDGVNVGTNSATYTNSALANGNVVSCVMTSNASCVSGSPATSNSITMSVSPTLPVSVSIAASSNPVCAGNAVVFTATPVNGGSSPSFQWKLNGSNVGSNSSTYTLSAPVNNDVITCVLTSNAGCTSGSPATSNAVTLTVNPNLPVSVSIAASSNPVCSGTSVTFTATPVNGGATPSYQWKLNGSNVGTNSPSYTTSGLANNDAVSCILTSNAVCPAGNPATSNVVTMTVNPLLNVSVSIVASSNPVCSGSSVTFTATPVNGGSTPVYQWKKNGVNVGSGTTTYTTSSLSNNDIITCVLTSNATCAAGSPATSNAITMTVSPNLPVSISISATSETICQGTEVTFTASPTNGGATPTYQWKLNGVNVGSNNTTYTNSGLTDADVISCILTSSATCSSGNPATSNSITMSVSPLNPVSVIVSSDPGNTICASQSVTFTASPTNGGLAPQYQWRKNGSSVGSDQNTYTDAALTDGDIITCVLTSSLSCTSGNPATSNQVAMTVTGMPSAPTSSSVSPASYNSDYAGTIDLIADGGGGTGATLTWYTGACGSGTAIGTGSPLTIAAPSQTTTYYARWENGNCNSGCISTEVTVYHNYRSKATGNWDAASTWEFLRGGSWEAAVAAPTSLVGTITVRSPHTVTVTATAGYFNVDEVTIDYGGKLVINVCPSNWWFNILNGPGTDININGIMEYQDDKVSMATGATMLVGDGGKFQHNLNYAGNYPITVPTATWHSNSTYEVLSSNQLAISAGLNQSFGHFTWNSTGQTSDINLGGSLTTVNGNLTILSTGTKTLTLTNTTALTLSIGGDLIIQNGILDFSAGAAPTKVINLYGNYQQTGGTFKNTHSGILSFNFKGLAKSFIQAAGTLTSTYINWDVAAAASLTLNNSLGVGSGRTFTLNGILDCGTNALTGSGSFTMTSGSKLIMASPSGITSTAGQGNLQLGSCSFHANTDFEYNGLSQQLTGDRLPSTIRHLTINNSAGVNLSASLTMNGMLTLTSGEFNISDKSLTLQNTDIPISRVNGTIRTNSGTGLSFGSAGNTAGAAFSIPAGLFANQPELNNFSVHRVNPLTLNNQPMSVYGVVLSNGSLITTNNLRLKSNAVQTALIDGAGTGSITGNVTIERYLPTGFGYKYLSSPFQALAVGAFSSYIDLSASFPAFYRYDENRTASGWVSYTNPASSLAAATGYAGNFGEGLEPVTMEVTGVVNNGAIAPLTLYNHNNTYTQGFNLVGNPYPSPIDWASANGWTRNNIDNAVYYFNTGIADQYSGVYSSFINGVSSDGIASSIIPALQGFFIHVTDGSYPVSGSLGMDNRVRVNNLNPTFHKSNSAVLPFLRLSAQYSDISGQADYFAVYLSDKSGPQFDPDFDALKLLNTDISVPNIYAIPEQGRKISIQSLPSWIDSTYILPLAVSSGTEGWIDIGLQQMDGFPVGMRVFFADGLTGEITEVDQEFSVKVWISMGETTDRFSLIFSYDDQTHIPPARDILQVHYAEQKLKIFMDLSKGTAATLQVTSMLGVQVLSTQLIGNGNHEIVLQVPTGVYLVSLHTPEGILTRKILISNP